MAHVYAADQGLQLQNETVESIMYDDAAMLLLVIKGGVVFAYDVAQDVPTHHEQLVWTYPLQDGPPVLSARCSLDRQMLAMQRSRLLVELVDLPSGNISVMQSDKGRSELLGLFFSELPDAQVVLVSRSGLELCTLAARRQGLHSRDMLRMPVQWHLYSHETRCCLVATGPPLGAPYLQAWQFLASGLVTLPPFSLSLPVLGTAPSATLPPPPTALLPALAAGAPQSPPPAGMGRVEPASATLPPPAAGAATAEAGAATAAPAVGFSFPCVLGAGGPALPISTPARSDEDVPASRAASPLPATGITVTMGGSGSGGLAVPPPGPPQPRGGTTTASDAAAGMGNAAGGKLSSWLSSGGATLLVTDMVPGGTVLMNPSASPGGAAVPLWPNVTAGAPTDAAVPQAAIRMVKLYGRVYCAHVNAAAGRLDLHRIFIDTVVLQHSYALPAAWPTPSCPRAPMSSLGSAVPPAAPAHDGVRLAVVDNVLVVLQPAAGAALLVDVAADVSQPLGQPRLLGHLAPLRRPRQLDQERLQQQLARQARAAAAMGTGGAGALLGSGTHALPPPVSWSVVDEEGQLLPPGGLAQWQVHVPNLVVDLRAQVVYRLLLDLGAVVRDLGQATLGVAAQAAVAALLQRRRAPRLHVVPLEALSTPPAPPQPAPALPGTPAANAANASAATSVASAAGSAQAPAGGLGEASGGGNLQAAAPTGLGASTSTTTPGRITASSASPPLLLLRLDSTAANFNGGAMVPRPSSLSTAQLELSLSSFHNLAGLGSPAAAASYSPACAQRDPVACSAATGGAGAGTPGTATTQALSPMGSWREGAGAGGGGSGACSWSSSHPHPVMLSGVVAPSAIVSKLMLLQMLQRMVAEGTDVRVLRQVLDATSHAFAEVVGLSGRAAAVAAACVVTPTELVQHVLPWSLASAAPCATAAAGTAGTPGDLDGDGGLGCALDGGGALDGGPASGALASLPARAALRQVVYAQAAASELALSLAMLGLPLPVALQLYSLQLTQAMQQQQQQQQAGQPLVPAATAVAVVQAPVEQVQLSRMLHSAAAGLQHAQQHAGGTVAPAGVRPAGVLAALAPEQLEALGAEAALDAAAAMRARRAAAVAGAGSGTFAEPLAPPVAGAAGGEAEDHGAALVRLLLRQRRFAKAARVARELRLSSVPPQELVLAASTGWRSGADPERVAALAALYRGFRTALQPIYPTLDALLLVVA